MRNVKNYSLLIVLGFFFYSCSKEDFEAEIPAYITIDDITLTTNYLTEGTASENITDAWVYINDDLVGVYELPAKFPVLKEGNVSIKVFAGIKNNGITSDRVRYLAYDPHEEQIDLVKGETVAIEPTIRYNSTVNFKWLEDFESASTSFLYHGNSDTIIEKQTQVVKEGNFSGKVYLESDMNFFEMTTVPLTGIPVSGRPVYLELDFKTNLPVTVGVYLDNNQHDYTILNTTSEWKKIYINLAQVIKDNNSGSSEFRVFFGILETSSNVFPTHPEIFFDNMKLIHF